MKKDGKSNRNLTEYKRSFINYFSLGYDARVGFGIYNFNQALINLEQVIAVAINLSTFGKDVKNHVVVKP